MTRRRGERGWWSGGRLWWRFVCLGALVGILAAPIHLLSWTLPTYNPVFVVFYGVYLVLGLFIVERDPGPLNRERCAAAFRTDSP